jgi:hypothetical protein
MLAARNFRGNMMTRLTLLACLALGLPLPAMAATAEATIVFPMEMVDTSGEPPRPGLAERLTMATRLLGEELAATGHYAPLDIAPFAPEIAAMPPRYKCGDCWMPLAQKAHAKYAVVASVHKISTLISSMDIFIADVPRGVWVQHIEGQIRGDTDEGYRRGIDFLIKDHIPPG